VRGGATARLFIAADPPEAVCGELARWARGALGQREGVRRIDAEALHVTLCFLGQRPLEEADELAAVVLGCAGDTPAGGGELEVGAPAWLPPRRPRVLAVELHDGSGALGELQAGVEAAVAVAVDWEPERRRFRPHVTVARMRAGTPVGGRDLPPTPALSFAPEALTLYRSRLRPSGAVYEPVARAELWG
jgi:2'-5' RNA ligase